MMFKINCLCCPRKQTRLESKLIHTADKIQFNSAPRPIGLWAELNWILSLVWINLLSNSFASSHNTGNFYNNFRLVCNFAEWQRVNVKVTFWDNEIWMSHYSGYSRHANLISKFLFCVILSKQCGWNKSACSATDSPSPNRTRTC